MALSPENRVALERRSTEIDRQIEKLRDQSIPLLEKWQKVVALRIEQKKLGVDNTASERSHLTCPKCKSANLKFKGFDNNMRADVPGKPGSSDEVVSATYSWKCVKCRHEFEVTIANHGPLQRRRIPHPQPISCEMLTVTPHLRYPVYVVAGRDGVVVLTHEGSDCIMLFHDEQFAAEQIEQIQKTHPKLGALRVLAVPSAGALREGLQSLPAHVTCAVWDPTGIPPRFNRIAIDELLRSVEGSERKA